MATCFVVQGFGKKTDYTDGRVLDLDASYAVIRRAVAAAGHECVRADEIMHSGTIDEPMYDRLLNSDLVIADLSTYNVNAAFELGVRYGLRPHATIVVAEEGFKHVFDVSHIVIRRYKHLGEDIGMREAERFQDELKAAIIEILGARKTDSPVYTFLHDLRPPWRQAQEQMQEAVIAALATGTPEAADAQTCKWLLETAMEKMSPRPDGPTLGNPSDFCDAVALLNELSHRRPEDPFILQQLALATYKSEMPTPQRALEAARELLRKLNPDTTNDPQTLGLWGAVHKHLWHLQRDPAQLDEAIAAYSRGFHLKQDSYNGVNYAFLLEARALRSALAGERDEAIADRVLARRSREELVRHLLRQIDDDDDAKTDLPLTKRYWLRASMWEACAGLGRADEVATWEAAHAA